MNSAAKFNEDERNQGYNTLSVNTYTPTQMGVT
jgi:hypothetical protein